MRRFFVLFVFIFISNNFIYSQFKSRINILINHINYESGLLTVQYSIRNAKENDKIRIWIDVFNSNKDTIPAKSWQGDVSKIVSGKEDKTAIWNLFGDGIDLIDSVFIKISATVENRFYLTDPIIASTIFPGLGDYQIRPKNPYWIYGAIGYTFLGSALGTYYSSINNYNKYLDANTIADKNKYYNNAVLSRNLSYSFLGLAGIIWAIDYIGILKRKKEIKQAWKKNLPLQENPNIPSFKIHSAISNKIFINTRLTNLKLVIGSVKYIDLDENSCLDAFEEGKLQFSIYNQGPANAVNFYAKIILPEKNANIILPDSILIGSIGINQTKMIQIPVKAGKDIENGNLKLAIHVSAKFNRPVEPIPMHIPTCAFKYKPNDANDLISDIDYGIPELSYNGNEKFALIIGNEGYANEFTGLSKNFNVPFARNDAIAFRNYAIKVLGVKEKNLIFLLDANKKEMYENILVLSDRVKQLKNRAELIFYYAGHGLADTITTAPFLMPVDISPDNLKSAVSLDSLYKKVADSKSTKSLVILDASFNNGGRNIGLRGPSAKKFIPRSEVIPSNTVVFSAVWKLSDIYLMPDKKHGLFTYAFLKTLKSTQGQINLLQLDNTVNTEILSVLNIPNENRATTTLFSKDISDIWPRWNVR